MVAGFAERLDLSRAKYTFAVVAMGGMGVSALHQLDRILRKQQNRRLDAAFAASMPGNFPPLMRSVPAGKCGKVLDRADRRLDEIAEAIGSDRFSLPRVRTPLRARERPELQVACKERSRCGGSLLRLRRLHRLRHLRKSLPGGEPHPRRRPPGMGSAVELCCACLHFCPTEAIQLNMMFGTEGRGRYRHLDVTVADMEAQR